MDSRASHVFPISVQMVRSLPACPPFSPVLRAEYICSQVQDTGRTGVWGSSVLSRWTGSLVLRARLPGSPLKRVLNRDNSPADKLPRGLLGDRWRCPCAEICRGVIVRDRTTGARDFQQARPCRRTESEKNHAIAGTEYIPHGAETPQLRDDRNGRARRGTNPAPGGDGAALPGRRLQPQPRQCLPGRQAPACKTAAAGGRKTGQARPR